MMPSVTWFGSFFFEKKIPSQIYSEMTEQIEAKLYRYNCLSMGNKKFPTYDIIHHMVWQPYWIDCKTFKKLLLQNVRID